MAYSSHSLSPGPVWSTTSTRSPNSASISVNRRLTATPPEQGGMDTNASILTLDIAHPPSARC